MCVIELCGGILYLHLSMDCWGGFLLDLSSKTRRDSHEEFLLGKSLHEIPLLPPVSSSWVLGTGLKACSTVGNHFHHEEPIQPCHPTSVADHRESHMSRAAPDADS